VRCVITTKFTGTVTKWFEARGFGFIRRDRDQIEIFGHIDHVDEAYDALQAGQRVAFEVVESDRKPGFPMCVNIDVIRN
jgi:cold shock CspA family protein